MATAIFVADLILPLGVAGGAPYTVLVLLGLWFRRFRYVVVLAGAATVLIVLGGFLSPHGEEIWQGVINRTLTILATWAISFLMLRHRSTQQALLSTTRQHQTYLDVAEVVMVALDRHGRVSLLNRKGCEILGCSEEEATGKNWFRTFIPERDAEGVEEVHRKLMAGEVEPVEYFENAVRAADGQERIMAWHNAVLRNEKGEVVGSLSSGEDITDRLRAEESLRKREALARLGQMAAVVAHEVKNPLSGIRGAIQVLGSRLPEEAEEQEVVQGILERLDALNRMSQELLLFARPRTPTLEPVLLEPLLHSTADLLTSDPALSGIQVDVSGAEGAIQGDAEQLKNVFLNLFLNAAQAMADGGTIRVRLEDGEGRCHIAVEDSGPGIPADEQERIFEPFFTTKHRGTGLGLAIAKQALEAHGGSISVSCPEGGGTRVLVSLPHGGP
jgi:PAS domain S-box-containing protein